MIARNILSLEETPLATNEEELLMAMKIVGTRKDAIYKAFRGTQNANSDVRKIY